MFGKIFASLYQGTLRGRADEILVFTNMIACADKYGEVDKTHRAIADEVGISEERVRVATANLEAADPDSRTTVAGGARIVRVDIGRSWGWSIVNYMKYREIRDAETRREQTRAAVARHRLRKQGKQTKPQKAHAEAEAEAEAEEQYPKHERKYDAQERANSNARDARTSARARVEAPIDAPGEPPEHIPDAERWRMVAGEPWAIAIRAAGAKVGGQNWRAWKSLADEHGLPSILAALKATAAGKRWPDEIEQKLEGGGSWEIINAEAIARQTTVIDMDKSPYGMRMDAEKRRKDAQKAQEPREPQP